MSKESMTVIDRIRICEMRGQTVALDSDLAAIYGVTTGNFNKAVGRNLERFPEDLTFILSPDEFEALIFQIGTSKGRGGRRKLPRVFTEHGAIMAATVLNSPRAVAMSVYVVRAFVRRPSRRNGGLAFTLGLGNLRPHTSMNTVDSTIMSRPGRRHWKRP